MDAVRQSLKTLQGLRDEGLITAAEFAQRRKAVLDTATSVPTASKASAESGAKSERKVEIVKSSSVFSRLGGGEATGSTGSTVDGAWGHDGYASLYGKQSAGMKKGKQITKPLSGAISKGSKSTDLRKKLTGGGDLRKKLSGRPAAALPEKCPW